MENKIFTSVIGFNFELNLVDNDGQPVRTGARRIDYLFSETPNVGTKIGGEKWFTNFNEPLLSKIRDYRRIND
jgi:Na+-translocating ferredoxin:NAD+ oxidoreductase RnfG subunit